MFDGTVFAVIFLMSHILVISPLSSWHFWIFPAHPFFFRQGNVYELKFVLAFIDNNNIWLSNLMSIDITLDCKSHKIL